MAKEGVQLTEILEDWWLSRVEFKSLILLGARRTGPGTWQPVLSLDVRAEKAAP